MEVRRIVNRGFSLAEVMVALMLLSVISMVLTGLIPATITGMQKAALRTNASMMAQNRLALMAQSGFGRATSTTAPHESYEVGGTEYVLRVHVGPAAMSSGSNMDEDVAKLLSVEITWNDKNGPQRLIERQVMFKRI